MERGLGPRTKYSRKHGLDSRCAKENSENKIKSV